MNKSMITVVLLYTLWSFAPESLVGSFAFLEPFFFSGYKVEKVVTNVLMDIFDTLNVIKR